MLAGIMLVWVAGKKYTLESVNLGAKKPVGRLFYPLSKYVLVPLAAIAIIAGAILGSIG